MARVFAPQIFQATGLKGRDAALFGNILFSAEINNLYINLTGFLLILANGISGSINLLATIPAMIFVKWHLGSYCISIVLTVQ